jgi:hypothetical protein
MCDDGDGDDDSSGGVGTTARSAAAAATAATAPAATTAKTAAAFAWPLGSHPSSRILFLDLPARTCAAILPTVTSVLPHHSMTYFGTSS